MIDEEPATKHQKVMKKQDVLFLVDKFNNQMTFEANMIAQRVGWFITSQAFMFSCLVLGIQTDDKSLTESLYYPVIPFLGLLICVFTWIAVKAASEQAETSRESLTMLYGDQSLDSETKDILLRLKASKKQSSEKLFKGRMPAKLLPITFALVWIWISISHIVIP